jgi:hypothetical protein
MNVVTAKFKMLTFAKVKKQHQVSPCRRKLSEISFDNNEVCSVLDFKSHKMRVG